LVHRLAPELGEDELGTAIEMAVRDLVSARILRCEGSIVKAAD
jgi:hypothetical protein